MAQRQVWLGLEFDETSDTFSPLSWIVHEDGSRLSDREGQYLPWHLIPWEERYNGNFQGPGYLRDSTGPDDDRHINYRYPFHRVTIGGYHYYPWQVHLKTDDEDYTWRELDCFCHRKIPGKTAGNDNFYSSNHIC